jgi:hypothetical protein
MHSPPDVERFFLNKRLLPVSFKVYSSSDPYSGFEEDLSGILNGESWSTAEVDAKKFYYVKAVSAK